jgi:hypothetical protein
MPNKSRGVTLTIFALLFLLMAISNFGKPFSHQGGVGFVFLGTRLSGVSNMVIAPIFGIILAVYAYGILAMRKYALPLGIFYACRFSKPNPRARRRKGWSASDPRSGPANAPETRRSKFDLDSVCRNGLGEN